MTLYWRSLLCVSMGALYRDLQLPLKPITGTVHKATPLTIHSWCVWKDNNSDPSAMMESQAKRLTVYLQNESWLHLTGQTILTLSSSLYRSYWDLTPVSWASLAAFSASLQTSDPPLLLQGPGSWSRSSSAVLLLQPLQMRAISFVF